MPILEHLSEMFRQFAFIGSLLAGFSFAIIFQLLASNDQRKRVTFMLGILLLASSSLLAATFISASVVISSGGLKADPDALKAIQYVANVGVCLLYLGFFSFLIGIGISGWLRSKVIGIISTILVIVCGTVMLIAIHKLGVFFIKLIS